MRQANTDPTRAQHHANTSPTGHTPLADRASHGASGFSIAHPQARPRTETERTRLLHGQPTLEDSNGCRQSPLIGSSEVLGSLFVQTVFWRAVAYLSWALVSLLTIRVFDSVELFGLISAALLVLGSLPALDGGFRNTLNRRILGRARDEETVQHVVGHEPKGHRLIHRQMQLRR